MTDDERRGGGSDDGHSGTEPHDDGHSATAEPHDDGTADLSSRNQAALATVVGFAVLARFFGPAVIPGTNAVASLAVAVAFAGGLLLGPVGALAAALGQAGAGLVDGLGGGGVLTVGTVGLVAALFRDVPGPVGSDGTIPPPTAGSIARLLHVAVLATLAATALAAAATTLVYGVPYYLVVASVGGSVLAGVLLASVLLVGALVVCVRVVERPATLVPGVGRPDGTYSGRLADVQRIESPWSPRSVAGLAIAWLLAGSALDLCFTLARTVPATFYRSRLGLDTSTALFNRLQLLAHGLVLVLVLATLWRLRAGGDGGSEPDAAGGAGGDAAEPSSMRERARQWVR